MGSAFITAHIIFRTRRLKTTYDETFTHCSCNMALVDAYSLGELF